MRVDRRAARNRGDSGDVAAQLVGVIVVGSRIDDDGGADVKADVLIQRLVPSAKHAIAEFIPNGHVVRLRDANRRLV